MKSIKKYPAFIDLSGRNVLIAGGGNACFEKLLGLENTSAKIHIISTFFKPQVLEYLEKHPEIQCEERPLEETDLVGRDLIFLATSDSETNAKFRAVAKSLKTWVNSVDDPNHCDFFSASVIDLGPVQFSISTDGRFAGVSSTLRKLLEEVIPESDSDLFETLFQMRKELKTILPDIEERRLALKKIIKDLESTYFRKQK
ncbi:MAG: bifunctional precorrin-2 dehydrogenase/sirohydrochlorin ferrochelatase [Leptospira sp.]|nr:bifunctional precorrin-2 dehydrogenase/sirohydrochlorin ferrochelatase [Leptospira sp.]